MWAAGFCCGWESEVCITICTSFKLFFMEDAEWRSLNAYQHCLVNYRVHVAKV